LPQIDTYRAIASLLAETPGLQPTTLERLGIRTEHLVLPAPIGEVTVGLPSEVDGSIDDRIAVVSSLSDAAQSTGSMLPVDDERAAEWQQVIDRLPTSALSDDRVDALATDLIQQFGAIRNSVEVPAGFSFTLTGRTTTLPIKLYNSSDTPLTVRVHMSSSKLLFPDGDLVQELQPLSFTEVPIKIEARTNGSFPVTLTVLTPTGDELAPPVTLSASVNALSGFGNLVTGAFLLVVLTWWVRHVRQNRRAGRPRRRCATRCATHRRTLRRATTAPVTPWAAQRCHPMPQVPFAVVSTNRVRIVTDSACDLPQSVADELAIEIVPLTIRIDGHEYVDRADLTPAEFWAKCAAAAELPSTAAPAPGQFEAVYRKLADEGATSVVAINLSAALSATMQSAELGARGVADVIPVTVVDSQQCTLGLGSIVMDCARLAAGGASHQAIVDRATDLATRTKVWGALDTLENLKKGGPRRRQGHAGSALAIKPIIECATARWNKAASSAARQGARLPGGDPGQRRASGEPDGHQRRLQRRRRVRRAVATALRRRDRGRRHRPGRRQPRRPGHHRHRVLRRELATHLSRAGPHIGLSTTERADKRWPSVRLPGNEGGSPLSSTNGHV
jgi:DegV family protein with EDD domain